MKFITTLACAALALSINIDSAHAAQYPGKSVELIVAGTTREMRSHRLGSIRSPTRST